MDPADHGRCALYGGYAKQADFVKKQPPNFIYTGEKKMVLRVRTQGVMLLVYFAYICVHFGMLA